MPRFADLAPQFLTLSPAACGALVAAIEDAIEVFGAWNIRVHPSSRAMEARRQLTLVAREESFGTTETQLVRTARSILLANDFYTITRSLPQEPKAPLSEDLPRMLGGSLLEDTQDTRPYETQSQFWVGALLAHSGLQPKALSGSGRRPDYSIDIEGSRLTVEVKRPQSADSVIRSLDTACEQVENYGIGGILAVDLSAALGLRNLPTVTDSQPDGPRPHEAAREPFDRLAEVVREHVRRSRPRSFRRTAGLIILARYCTWHSPAKADLDFGFFLSALVCEGALAGLYEHFMERVIFRLPIGVKRISGNPMVPRA